MSDGAPPDHAAIAPLVEADTGPLSSGTSVERGQGVYDPRLPRSRATAFLPDDLRAEFAKRTLAEEYTVALPEEGEPAEPSQARVVYFPRLGLTFHVKRGAGQETSTLN